MDEDMNNDGMVHDGAATMPADGTASVSAPTDAPAEHDHAEGAVEAAPEAEHTDETPAM